MSKHRMFSDIEPRSQFLEGTGVLVGREITVLNPGEEASILDGDACCSFSWCGS